MAYFTKYMKVKTAIDFKNIYIQPQNGTRHYNDS